MLSAVLIMVLLMAGTIINNMDTTVEYSTLTVEELSELIGGNVFYDAAYQVGSFARGVWDAF